jgi:hypothetical protein
MLKLQHFIWIGLIRNLFLSFIYFRILGYRRAVPTVGRVVNMTSELMDVAERRLRKTFFISPGLKLQLNLYKNFKFKQKIVVL